MYQTFWGDTMKTLPLLFIVFLAACQPETPKRGDIYEHLLTQSRYKVDIYGVDTLRTLYAKNPAMVTRLVPEFIETESLMSAPWIVLREGDSQYPTKIELLSVFEKEYKKVSQ